VEIHIFMLRNLNSPVRLLKNYNPSQGTQTERKKLAILLPEGQGKAKNKQLNLLKSIEDKFQQFSHQEILNRIKSQERNIDDSSQDVFRVQEKGLVINK